MRILVISANLGSYDMPHEWVTQKPPVGCTIDVKRLNDQNFWPRTKAMTSRLQCGIPKMFGWELFPGYDRYLWVDASCALLNENCVSMFIRKLGTTELAVFRHPDRSTVKEEVEFMIERMARHRETYLNSRYGGEWIQAQYEYVLADPSYTDDALYASTAFMYKPTERVKQMSREWWYCKSRYLLHDQIAWPYVINKSGCSISVIDENYTKCEYMTFVRNRK